LTDDKEDIILDDGVTFDINLPLKLSIDIYSDDAITTDIPTKDISDIRYELASVLSNTFTGTRIKYYNSKISSIINTYSWVKTFDITITDSSTSPITLSSGFEMIDQNDIFQYFANIKSAEYTPIYVWWDLNNITINIY
jgi:hypothetical protein